MRVYADSSFILRLLLAEKDSPQVIAEFRRLQSPALFFSALHALEIECGIRQRAFFRRESRAAQNSVIAQERDSALSRAQAFLARQTLREVTFDSDAVFKKAGDLAVRYAEKIGARSIDILHIASALELETELFLTTDKRQAQVAKGEGLKVGHIG